MLKGVFVVTVIAIVLAVIVLLFSDTIRTFLGLRSVPFPGDPAQFDPVAAYPKVVKIAGSMGKLNTIEAKYVQPNGTLNLNAEYRPSVRYSFVREYLGKDKVSGPVGTGRPSGKFENVTVVMEKPAVYSRQRGGGCQGENRTQHLSRYMWRRATRSSSSGKLADPPKCSFADLWKKAIARGLPTNAVAIIRYSRRGYEFHIQGRRERLHFRHDCSLSRSRR